MNERNKSRLTRPRHAMPSFVRKALMENGVMEAYRLRPPYQQNDYLGWITRAKLEPTRKRRLARGERYMNMAYRPKRA